MQILGVEFQEREHLLCRNCAEAMVVTERRPDLRRGPGYELQLFECYNCRQSTRISVAMHAKSEELARR
jgi:hypothetical protein